jgi:hypothetical protein
MKIEIANNEMEVMAMMVQLQSTIAVRAPKTRTEVEKKMTNVKVANNATV